MELLLIALVVILGVTLVAVTLFGYKILEDQRAADATGQQSAVDAAVKQVLVEREATAQTVVADRASTVEAVVNSAVQQAAAALDARLNAGSAQIDQRMKAGSAELDQRMMAGTQELAIRTELFEKQAGALGEGLQRVNTLVEHLRKEGATQQEAVVGQLRETQRRTAELHQTAAQLKTVLASPKNRGQWGERMAEDVLSTAGFRDGINYVKQTKIASGGIPDFTFLLPRGLQLHMDVKFPVDNYVRYLEAESDAEQQQAAVKFRADVRMRIKELQGRGYIDPETTVDTVLLFIPNESVYAFLHENDGGVIDVALKQKIVLCSPVTLFSVLSVIRQSVDNFRLEQRSSEILVELGKFQEEWTRFSDHLDKTDKQLQTFTKSFSSLASTRRNQLGRSLKRIDDLEAVQSDIEVRPRLAGDEPAATLGPAPRYEADGDDAFPDANDGPHLREVAG